MMTFLFVLVTLGLAWLAWHEVRLHGVKGATEEAQLAAEEAAAEAQRIGDEAVAAAERILGEAKNTLTRAHKKSSASK